MCQICVLICGGMSGLFPCFVRFSISLFLLFNTLFSMLLAVSHTLPVTFSSFVYIYISLVLILPYLHISFSTLLFQYHQHFVSRHTVQYAVFHVARYVLLTFLVVITGNYCAVVRNRYAIVAPLCLDSAILLMVNRSIY